jgi:hypothetical protein
MCADSSRVIILSSLIPSLFLPVNFLLRFKMNNYQVWAAGKEIDEPPAVKIRVLIFI